MALILAIVQVIGYSWQNTHYRFGEFLYYGINLAWVRGSECAVCLHNDVYHPHRGALSSCVWVFPLRCGFYR